MFLKVSPIAASFLWLVELMVLSGLMTPSSASEGGVLLGMMNLFESLPSSILYIATFPALLTHITVLKVLLYNTLQMSSNSGDTFTSLPIISSKGQDIGVMEVSMDIRVYAID